MFKLYYHAASTKYSPERRYVLVEDKDELPYILNQWNREGYAGGMSFYTTEQDELANDTSPRLRYETCDFMSSLEYIYPFKNRPLVWVKDIRTARAA